MTITMTLHNNYRHGIPLETLVNTFQMAHLTLTVTITRSLTVLFLSLFFWLDLSTLGSCHADSFRLHHATPHCSGTEIEIMIMCPSDCIKVLPLQKKAGRHEMQMTMWSRWIECHRLAPTES